MNTQNTNEIVFGIKWFEKHQSKLLWLLNTPVIKYWFRWIMRIYCKDTINRITPNSYSFGAKIVNDKIEVKTDFRTHDKYSKRLYYAFKPIWYVMHALDWAMLDRVEALTHLSFGFSTLTQYPGSIGTDNPVDGYIANVGGAGDPFSTVQSASTGTSTDTATDDSIPCQDSYNGSNYVIRRGVFCFDTSSLTSGAIVSSVVFSIAGSGSATVNADTRTAYIVAATPAATNTLSTSDYSLVGSTTFASMLFSSWTTTDGTYNDFTLDSNGIANISKTGITKYGVRTSGDISVSAPTGTNRIMGWFSEKTGTSKDPKVVVTYTVASGPANIKTFGGLAIASTKKVDDLAIASIKTWDGIA